MLRIIIAAPFLFLLVLFALSNPQPTEFKLWPTDYTAVLPLSLAVLGAMGVAFLLGALLLWLSVLSARARARRAEYRVKLLEAQVAELKARLAPVPAARPEKPALLLAER
jgi:lipopolysaccharide assembly protein A